MNVTRISEIVRRIEAELVQLKAELAGQTSRLQQFIDVAYHRVDGRQVPFADFFSSFRHWLKDDEREAWSKPRVIQELGLQVVETGRSDQPRKMIVGLSLTPAPRPMTIESNPDYDGTALYWLTKPWYREEKLSYAQIAARLNEQGYKTQDGKAWGWIDAQTLVHD